MSRTIFSVLKGAGLDVSMFIDIIRHADDTNTPDCGARGRCSSGAIRTTISWYLHA